MYNILLVDDEPGHLAGLSKMLQKLRPQYAISTARNGKEALSKCREQPFQLIISDIQMPLMNGLDFLEQLPPSNQPQKFIYLSGYDYFDYAQKAIGLGTFDYLLKPVDQEKFALVLEKAERSLKTEQEAQLENSRLAVKLNTIAPLYRSRVMKEWLHNQALSKAESKELEELLGFGGPGILLLTEIRLNSRATSQPEERLLPRIQQELEACLAPSGGAISSIPLHEAEGGRTGRLITVTNASISAQQLQAIQQKIQQAVPSFYQITIGVSRQEEDVLASASQMYVEAGLALSESFYDEVQTVFHAWQTKVSAELTIKPDARHEAMLHEAVVHGQEQGQLRLTAGELLHKLLGEAGSGLPRPERLTLSVQKLLARLSESLTMPEHQTVEEWGLRMERALGEADSLGALQTVIAEQLGLLASAHAEAKREHKEQLIYKCIAYIDEHYMDDLSLESVAAVFHFNASYFSQYFKSKLNINFSQYVTQVRLTKARQLLESSNDKIYQVAGSLGYHDVKYFNRVFKKEFGLTPEEYRSIARHMKRS
ncbi:two-component system, response regulator YesN [Paenibacillus algorifonticola]|uniref:Two-component system, response regulator YesN n=1 Tax=Paenibacillus algorifonticola TaxID=684063 RepID=A0A1I1Z714_9BACL|nr:response regulator [Paenibacillus algorifonticola]SFE27342.1 two-component system, response regulator YesN [Paenibacillus algorifonticola]